MSLVTVDHRRATRLGRIQQGIDQLGCREFTRHHLRHLAQVWLLAGLLRRISSPGLEELSGSGRWCSDASDALRHLLPVESAMVAGLEKEFGRLTSELASRRTAPGLRQRWSVESGTDWILYALVRLTRPRLVLETGVADGNSSFTILRALIENGSGLLVSTDIDASAGWLLSSEERQRWSFHRLDIRRARREFTQLVRSLPSIDLFFHDSDHTYRGQMSEYTTVESKLADNAFLVSDDIDYSYAFLDYCARRGTPPVLLLDATRVAGFLPPRPKASRW